MFSVDHPQAPIPEKVCMSVLVYANNYLSLALVSSTIGL